MSALWRDGEGEPMNARERAKEAIDALAKDGCACDVMYGYACGIHVLAAKAHSALDEALREAYQAGVESVVLDPPEETGERVMVCNDERCGRPDREHFERLRRAWKDETAHLSIIRSKSMHPTYQRIIGMGERALRPIFESMSRKPDFWFWALESITGEDPVPRGSRGDLKAETEHWLVWARLHGYLN